MINRKYVLYVLGCVVLCVVVHQMLFAMIFRLGKYKNFLNEILIAVERSAALPHIHFLQCAQNLPKIQ